LAVEIRLDPFERYPQNPAALVGNPELISFTWARSCLRATGQRAATSADMFAIGPRGPLSKQGSETVKRNILLAGAVTISTLLVLAGVDTAMGQAKRAGNTGADARVALVDIAYIFNNYTKFKNATEDLKDDAKAREDDLAKVQADLKSLVGKRSQLNPDTPTYKDVEQKIATRKAEMELMADGFRREFTQREANVYHQTYQEVEAAIRKYSEAYGITLVLRAARTDDVSASNPKDVIKEVSQQVIYSVPEMDITDEILAMLNPPTAPATKPTIPSGAQKVPSQGQPKTKVTLDPTKGAPKR
jgi:Skp family chaperone for outer membrane proteins